MPTFYTFLRGVIKKINITYIIRCRRTSWSFTAIKKRQLDISFTVSLYKMNYRMNVVDFVGVRHGRRERMFDEEWEFYLTGFVGFKIEDWLTVWEV